MCILSVCLSPVCVGRISGINSKEPEESWTTRVTDVLEVCPLIIHWSPVLWAQYIIGVYAKVDDNISV